MDLIRLLRRMQPFGPGNQRPKFSISGVQPHSLRSLGNNHVKFRISDSIGSFSLECIAWNMLDQFEDTLAQSKTMDLAFVPQLNRWNGQENIQLIIRDFRPSQMDPNSKSGE